MATDTYGFRQGTRNLIKARVDASTTAPIEAGDILTLGTAGYVQKATAGDMAYGVAVERIASAPAADGDAEILMDISLSSTYEYPPDSGSVDVSKLFKTCDVGGARSVDHDATVDDCLLIVGVDTVKNTYLVQLRPTHAGV